MPPKKVGKKKGPPPEPPKTVEQLVNELADKNLTLKELGLQLSRVQEERQQLDSQGVQLTDELERAKEDLHDINEFLTNQLKGSALKVAGLEARVKELESKLLVQDKAHQAAMKQLNSDWAADRSLQSAAIAARDADAAAGRAAVQEQAAMKAAVEDAKQQASDARREARLKTEEAERQAAEFKERVRLHADKTMREFEERAKREALGNASQAFADMTKALQKTRAELEDLAQRTHELMGSESELRRELELARGREGDYLKRSAMFKRALTLLTDRVQEAEEQRAQHADASAQLQSLVAELEEAASKATMRAAEATHETKTLKRELDTIRGRGGVARREPITLGEELLGSLTGCINAILQQRSGLPASQAPPPDDDAVPDAEGQQLQPLSLYERQMLAGTLREYQQHKAPERTEGLQLSLDEGPPIGAWRDTLGSGLVRSLSDPWNSSLKLVLTDVPNTANSTAQPNSWAADPAVDDSDEAQDEADFGSEGPVSSQSESAAEQGPADVEEDEGISDLGRVHEEVFRRRKARDDPIASHEQKDQTSRTEWSSRSKVSFRIDSFPAKLHERVY